MQLLKSAERSFVKSLVARTKSLVENNELETVQKVVIIQRAIAENARRSVALREKIVFARADERILKLRTLIDIREKATAYLAATAKWLIHVDKHPESTRHLPQTFASPNWAASESKEPPKKTQEFPFMEFSS